MLPLLNLGGKGPGAIPRQSTRQLYKLELQALQRLWTGQAWLQQGLFKPALRTKCAP